jgi:hypothetical protein
MSLKNAEIQRFQFGIKEKLNEFRKELEKK